MWSDMRRYKSSRPKCYESRSVKYRTRMAQVNVTSAQSLLHNRKRTRSGQMFITTKTPCCTTGKSYEHTAACLPIDQNKPTFCPDKVTGRPAPSPSLASVDALPERFRALCCKGSRASAWASPSLCRRISCGTQTQKNVHGNNQKLFCHVCE